MSVADAAIQKKIFGSSTTALIISIEEMKDRMKMVKLCEEVGSLKKELLK